MIGLAFQHFDDACSALAVFAGCQDLDAVLSGYLHDALIGEHLKGDVVVGYLDLEGVVRFRHAGGF